MIMSILIIILSFIFSYYNTMRETTYWEDLVAYDYNPNSDDLVFKTKTQYARIIDMLDKARKLEKKDPEYQRYLSIAITEAQTACMWAVKALSVK